MDLENKAVDKFTQLYEDEKLQELFADEGPSQSQPDSTSTAKPPEPQGSPAAPGDFGKALENIENVGTIPGVTEPLRSFREKMKPTT